MQKEFPQVRELFFDDDTLTDDHARVPALARGAGASWASSGRATPRPMCRSKTLEVMKGQWPAPVAGRAIRSGNQEVGAYPAELGHQALFCNTLLTTIPISRRRSSTGQLDEVTRGHIVSTDLGSRHRHPDEEKVAPERPRLLARRSKTPCYGRRSPWTPSRRPPQADPGQHGRRRHQARPRADLSKAERPEYDLPWSPAIRSSTASHGVWPVRHRQNSGFFRWAGRHLRAGDARGGPATSCSSSTGLAGGGATCRSALSPGSKLKVLAVWIF